MVIKRKTGPDLSQIQDETAQLDPQQNGLDQASSSATALSRYRRQPVPETRLRPIQSGPICTRVRPFGRLTPDSGSLTPNPQRRFRSAMLSQEHEFTAHPISEDRRASQLCGGVNDMRGRIHFSHLWSNTFSQIIFSAPS